MVFSPLPRVLITSDVLLTGSIYYEHQRKNCGTNYRHDNSFNFDIRSDLQKLQSRTMIRGPSSPLTRGQMVIHTLSLTLRGLSVSSNGRFDELSNLL